MFYILPLHHGLFINLDYEHNIGYYPICQGYLAACYLSIQKNPTDHFFLTFFCGVSVVFKQGTFMITI